jgi:hypothetical protein
MKQQIERFSPHQNAKVFAVLMALSSLLIVVPILLIGSLLGPRGMGPPFFMAVLFPLLYLVIGYVTVIVGCLLYNVMYKYIGGIEFEANERDT